MSNKTPILISLLAILVGVSAGPLLAEEGAAPKKTYSLTYKFAPDEALRFRISQKLTGSRTVTGSSKPAPIDAELSTTIMVMCMRIVTKGIYELAVHLESGTLKLNGEVVDDYSPPVGTRVFWMAEDGRLVKRVLTKSGDTLKPSTLDVNSPECLLLLATLPDKPVAVGDSWSADIPVLLGTTTNVKLSSELAGLKQISNANAALIREKVSTPVTPNAPAGPMTENSQSGQIELMLSLDTGKLLASQGTMHTVISSPEKKSGKSVQAASTTVVDSNFTVQLLADVGGNG
jgi:hypothetical protein